MATSPINFPARAACAERLAAGMQALGVALPDVQENQNAINKLLDYMGLLMIANAQFNLTSIREPLEIVDKHLLDSLAVIPHLPKGALADIGTGAGLPGIPLAIMQSDRQIYLVESTGKKANFLREAVAQLELSNAHVLHQRAEAAVAVPKVAGVIARAVATLPELLRYSKPWLTLGGQLLAMKGPRYSEEVAELPKGYKVSAVYELRIPGLDAQRFFVVITR